MKLDKQQISDLNTQELKSQSSTYQFLADRLETAGKDVASIVQKIQDFQVAIPSWALGQGGTRFGRFSIGGEPTTLEQKLDDIGLLHKLTHTAGAVSLHIPWDTPHDYEAVKEHANLHGILFDAVNSNTFQDQPDSLHSYKYGSLSSVNKEARQQAIEHTNEVIQIGNRLGSKSLTVWLADGSNFPGQHNFQDALHHTKESLQEIYKEMPKDFSMFIEYKPYEPNFYSTVIQDWGTSLFLAESCGDRAYTLVDLGHHLPNTNIEQIVATLLYRGRLGGFHFNDSKYGDDDLTVGSVKPYALFLIFNELVYGMENNSKNPSLSWMIDASHNTKDPLEDLLQSLEAIQVAYAQALLIDHDTLKQAQQENDVVKCQQLLQDAYRTDVRPLIQQAALKANAAIDPLGVYRKLNIRKQLIKERGEATKATGL
ncbi:sugar isomerase [Flavobacteriaceae bacterium M23B6Z8]